MSNLKTKIMRKSVRFFLLSMFAFVLSANAQTDLTGTKLWNGDCQTGMSGWNITFTNMNND